MSVVNAIIFEPRTHRWTAEEYMRMAGEGYFNEQRVELIDGEIVDMPPQKNAHMYAVTRLMSRLLKLFDEREFWVRVQGTYRISEKDAPEPDFIVLEGAPTLRDDVIQSPLLAVEVSDTTLQYDRKIKGSLYASHGVPEYWVVNILGREIEVYRDPVADSQQKYGWRYAGKTIHKAGERVTPLAREGAFIEVGELFG